MCSFITIAAWAEFCEKCGNEIGANAAFCRKCGAKVIREPVVKPQNSTEKAVKTPKESIVSKHWTNSIGMKFCLIPEGSFMMGSPESEARRETDEGPQHQVTISKSFYMGQSEVTQKEYEEIMGNNPSNFKGNNLPVEIVSWNDAKEFCRKLSLKDGKTYRLPTEAEWEYACRADTNLAFHFGNRLDASKANFDGNKPYGIASTGVNLQKTAEVGSFKANAWGLNDMHGNVSEWCEDYYVSDYYENSEKIDPQGPSSGTFRVCRGGGWSYDAGDIRSAYRSAYKPTEAYYDIGFRVILVEK